MNDHAEKWRDATVDMILRLRLWAIRYGASPLSIWEQVSDRVRLAARLTNSVEAWCSNVSRSLRVGPVDADTSRAMVELAALVGSDADRWLTWLEDEHQFLMAMARARFDQSKAKGKTKTKELSP